MGLGEAGKPKTYLTVSNGKITMSVKQGEPGAEARKNKLGREVWEKHYRNVSGYITNVFEENHQEYGRSFKVQIEDGEEVYLLQLQENSKYWNHFCQIFPNINLSQMVTIAPYSFSTPTSGDKNIVGLNVLLNGVKIPNHFIVREYDKTTNKVTKIEYLNNFPEPGKDLDPDDFKIYGLTASKFLRKYFQDNIKPIFEKMEKGEPVNTPEPVDDNLPF